MFTVKRNEKAVRSRGSVLMLVKNYSEEQATCYQAVKELLGRWCPCKCVGTQRGIRGKAVPPLLCSPSGRAARLRCDLSRRCCSPGPGAPVAHGASGTEGTLTESNHGPSSPSAAALTAGAAAPGAPAVAAKPVWRKEQMGTGWMKNHEKEWRR